MFSRTGRQSPVEVAMKNRKKEIKKKRKKEKKKRKKDKKEKKGMLSITNKQHRTNKLRGEISSPAPSSAATD